MSQKLSDRDLSTISNQLYATMFNAIRYRMRYENTADFRQEGKMFSSFCLILKGTVQFESEEETFSCKEGDFVYFPDSIHYISNWRGEPEIEFISLNFRFSAGAVPNPLDSSPSSMTPLDKQFCLQRIDELGDFRERDNMEKMLTLNSEHIADQIMATSILYRILAESYPYLKRSNVPRIPSCLLPAINYIRQNYEKNEKVGYYAKLANLSESRFYSMFRDAMKYPPIEYRNKLRAYEAGNFLRQTTLTVEEISERLGFESVEYFRRVFKKFYQQTPSQFRKGYCKAQLIPAQRRSSL